MNNINILLLLLLVYIDSTKETTERQTQKERDSDKQRWEKGVSLKLWGLSQSPHGCFLAPQCALIAGHGRFLAFQCALVAHGQVCFQWRHLRALRG